METETFKTWPESAARLVAVAAGRDAADTVIKGGKWVNVHTREVLDNHDIAIANGRFAFCGPDASHCIGPDTEVIEANGAYMIPGLCDAHMHIESGMLTPAEFTRAVAPHGTTTMFTD
ncbi:MAG: adenine deaminase, partial [Halocynthiibacter sp.]